MPSSLELLRLNADPRWIDVRPGSGLRVRADMALPDGEPRRFELRIEDSSGLGLVMVWEDGSEILPNCPARHFYTDRSFCLGYGESGPPLVRDAESARRWWAVLRGYLELQLIAELTGEWPPQHARAHGQAAAWLEEAVECLAPLLPAGVWPSVRDGDVALATRPGRVTNRRRLCPCGSQRRIKGCHEPALVELVGLRAAQAELEKPFWEYHSGKPCCGTMRHCPLRANPSMEEPSP